jgi:phosphohistidine phosphatase SixA
MIRRVAIAAFLVISTAGPLLAGQAAFVVRHAERADAGTAGAGMMANDPELSDAGRARAEALATALKDAGITAIYATQFRRTQQTAAALAKALGLTVTVVPANDTKALVEKIKASTGNTLVVGHSNTVPEVIRGLGVATEVKIGENEYDNLFVVTAGPKPSLFHLHLR